VDVARLAHADVLRVEIRIVSEEEFSSRLLDPQTYFDAPVRPGQQQRIEIARQRAEPPGCYYHALRLYLEAISSRVDVDNVVSVHTSNAPCCSMHNLIGGPDMEMPH